MNKTIGIQYSATVTSINKDALSYTVHNDAVATLKYSNLKELMIEYSSVKNDIKAKIEELFIKKHPNNIRSTVYVKFDTYEIVYDSQRDGGFENE